MKQKEYPKHALFELLADIEHQKWSHWQKYMHSKMEADSDEYGNIDYLLPEKLFEHWERQIKTKYKDLTEKEKDSDREQVMRYWKYLGIK